MKITITGLILVLSGVFTVFNAIAYYRLKKKRSQLEYKIFNLDYEKQQLLFETDNIVKDQETLLNNKKELEGEISTLINQTTLEGQHLQHLKSQIEEKQRSFQDICQNVEDQLLVEKNMEETSRQAFSNFCQILEKDYEQKDKDYNLKIEQCEQRWKEIQQQWDLKKQETQQEIEQLQNAYRSLQEATTQAEQIKEKQDFYRLKPTEEEITDILLFEEFKKKVHNKRAVSMLIWTTWFQKPMTALCTKILGVKVICGIYKITNIINGRCYIGESMDIASRWKQHAKCGVGIDTPANNKLYKAMMENGIWNFTWEVLEECPQQKSNEREKYYIDLYMAKDLGYNSIGGITK